MDRCLISHDTLEASKRELLSIKLAAAEDSADEEKEHLWKSLLEKKLLFRSYLKHPLFGPLEVGNQRKTVDESNQKSCFANCSEG